MTKTELIELIVIALETIVIFTQSITMYLKGKKDGSMPQT